MQRFLTYRALNIWASLFIIFIVALALYTELYQGIHPCPLCIMQRVVFIVLAILFIIAALYVPKTLVRRSYQFLIFLVTLFGCALSLRHIYLQHLPANSAPNCGPSFNFIIQNLPWSDALPLLLRGSGECSRINWHLLGMTMPEWSLLCFIFLAIISLFQLIRKRVL